MKSILYYCIFCSLFLACTNNRTNWDINYNSTNKSISVIKDGRTLTDNLYVTFKLNDQIVTSKQYSEPTVTTSKIKDFFGKGTKIDLIYFASDLPTITQSFYLYGKDYFLTEATISSNENILSINYISPITVETIETIKNCPENRTLFIPFDNDCWVRYESKRLSNDTTLSYEVGAVFNNTTRNGIIVGSIEHDKWKTGVEVISNNENNIIKLTAFGGITDKLTRDSKPHGYLKGNVIKSPKMFFGNFNDWRDGLDEYGNANAVVAPPKTWNKMMPFGWNSWGVLQFNLTFDKAMEVSDFFKQELQENGFVNEDNLVYIGLDSGWNSFTEEELKAFVAKCKENGQVAGIYWTPFTDWGKNPERNLPNDSKYKYKDVYIYANGKPQELDGAYAVDPTHPEIERGMKITSELFKRCGFEYVKMDFMTHGAMEADSWHNKSIQTGIQAYNYGMTLLDQYFGEMYINLSISPIFPAHYAESRRIACDAWNKIKDTEYTMNALSYGWWIDKVYQYNDADHIVLRDATEGENRARITSAVITGLYIGGDDYSQEGCEDGKNKSKQFLTNKRINSIANGKSFRPVEGNSDKSEHQFIREDKEGIYYVCFNYSDNTISCAIPFDRINLTKGTSYDTTELWSNEKIDLNKDITIPAKDVVVLFIKK